MKIEIEVPDGIIQFLKDVAQYDDAEIERYIEKAVQSDSGSSWDAFLSDPGVFMNIGKLIDRYNLESTPTLRTYIKNDC